MHLLTTFIGNKLELFCYVTYKFVQQPQQSSLQYQQDQHQPDQQLHYQQQQQTLPQYYAFSSEPSISQPLKIQSNTQMLKFVALSKQLQQHQHQKQQRPTVVKASPYHVIVDDLRNNTVAGNRKEYSQNFVQSFPIVSLQQQQKQQQSQQQYPLLVITTQRFQMPQISISSQQQQNLYEQQLPQQRLPTNNVQFYQSQPAYQTQQKQLKNEQKFVNANEVKPMKPIESIKFSPLLITEPKDIANVTIPCAICCNPLEDPCSRCCSRPLVSSQVLKSAAG